MIAKSRDGIIVLNSSKYTYDISLILLHWNQYKRIIFHSWTNWVWKRIDKKMWQIKIIMILDF